MMHNLMIIIIFPTVPSAPQHVSRVGQGPRAMDRLSGRSFCSVNSYLCYLQLGFKVRPDLTTVEWGKEKKRVYLKKKVLSRKLLSQYHCAQPMRHKEKSPHSRAVCSTG